MDDEIPPPCRPYRIRRPSSSLISSTTSPIFPAPQPPSTSLGSARSSASRINTFRDIDEDIQPSSSTSFSSTRQRSAQNIQNNYNPSSSSSAGRSSSPLGSPDSTFWGPSPSPIHSSSSFRGSAGPPTPGGNCAVSSSTVDDIPPSPFFPEENVSGSLMLPPLASSSSSTTSASTTTNNAVSVISGSRNHNSNQNNNDSSEFPGPSSSTPWFPSTTGGGRTVSSSSLVGNSLSFGGNSALNNRSGSFTSSLNGTTSTSAPVGQLKHNESYSSNTVSSFNLSPVRSKIKKASSFERFSAQAQASSNSNNLSGNNSSNSSNETCTTLNKTSASTIVSNSSSISNVPGSTSVAAGAPSSSRLLWDYSPSSASISTVTTPSTSRVSSAVTGSVSLGTSLSESFNSTKPFHLKKFAAKIASVFEQEQLTEAAASSVTQTQSQVQQSSGNSNNNAIEDSIIRTNQGSCFGLGLGPPRASCQSPLNLTEGMGATASTSSSLRNSAILPTKSFLTKNTPLPPKQKLLQRLQSGELFNSSSPPPPPTTTLPPTPIPSPVPQQSAIQQQHQILLSSLQQPLPSSLLIDSLHIQQQQETIMTGSETPTPPPLSPSTSPTPRASAELERYVNSMSISNYEAFIRASGDDFVVQDSLGKNIDPGDLNNIQVLYDSGDPYTYYYGNILVDEIDFASATSSAIPGTSSAAGSSTSAAGRQFLVMPSGSGGLDDPAFQGQQQLQQGHGHLEFVLGLNCQEDERQHELREDDLQLGDISHHQSFLDPNDSGMSLSMGKSQAESTLRNLLMMEPLRVHDDSWISAASAAEYQNRIGLGVRGINLNTNTGSSGCNSSSVSLNNSWINDWPNRANSWQQSHHDLVDHEEQNEVMDMSILDMTDKGHGKRQGHAHPQGQSGVVSMHDVELVAENSATSGLPHLTPMDLQQPLGLSLTTTKNSEGSEPIDLQHPHMHQHSHHRILIEDQEDDEPVNLMAVVNLEHELAQAQAQHQQNQSQHELVQGQMQNSNSTYSSGELFASTTAPSKVLPPQVSNFTHNFDAISQTENLGERKIIHVKKTQEIDPLGSNSKPQKNVLMSSAVSPSSSTTSSGTPGPGLVAANVILDKPVQPRSYASLPSLLSISRISETGWTIVINRNKVIMPNTRFGPVEGPLRKVYQEDLDHSDAIYPCLIMVDSTNTFWQLDRNDDELCNWMKFVRLAHSSSSQNVLISEINGVLFFTTCKHIPPKAELQAGYDFEYAQRYGLKYLDPSSSNPEFSELEVVEKTDDTMETFVCIECELDFVTAEEFNDHVVRAHREHEIHPKKKVAIKRYLNSKSTNSIRKAKTIVSKSKVRNKEIVSTDFTLDGSILCKHCGSVYLSMDELKKHLKDSAPCGRTGSVEVLIFKAKENVEGQLEVNQGDETVKITTTKTKCSICYKGFATRDRLDRHMLVHNGEELKPLQCNFCVKRFLTNSALAGHIKTHAEEGKCFECPMCSFATQQLLQLKEHVQSHKNKENGMFYCPHCVKRFTLYSMIRKHIRAFHGPRQFTCDLCPAAFPSSDKLKLHKLKHSDHREFLCAECGRQFKRKDKLREHTKRMHENKKKHIPITPEVLHIPTKKEKMLKKFSPKVTQEEFSRFIYKCMDCMLGFKRRGMLVNHLAKRHPDKPPQQVPELNLPILRPSRSYFCPYCDRVYKSSSKRKSHILKSHPGKQIPPQLRGKDAMSTGKQRVVRVESLPVTTVTTNANKQGAVELYFQQQELPVVTTTTSMTAVDDNGVSGNVVILRRDPVMASPHGCQWCHRQYATRAKLLQHQRKSHLHLMPPEIQTPRTQKNNVSRSMDNTGIITVSVTDVAPLHSQTLEFINSSSHIYTTLDQEMLGNHSEKLSSEVNPDSSVIGFLLTTTTVTNGDFENVMEPEIVMLSSMQQTDCKNNPLPLTNSSNPTSLTTLPIPISANDLQHQNIVNVNHVISSTGLNHNLNPILTKTDC